MLRDIKQRKIKDNLVIIFVSIAISMLFFYIFFPSLYIRREPTMLIENINPEWITGYTYNDGLFETVSRDPQIVLPQLTSKADGVEIILSDVDRGEEARIPLEVQVYAYDLGGYPSEAESIKHSFVVTNDRLNDIYFKKFSQGDCVRVDIGSRVGISYKIDAICFFYANFGIYPKTILCVGILSVVLIFIFSWLNRKRFGYIKEIICQNKISVVCVGITILFFTCFYYSDLLSTTRHGINIWESIKQKEFLSFYSFNLRRPIGYDLVSSAIYNIVVFFCFAIWNLPLWIYEQIRGWDSLMTPIGLLYSKLFLIVLTIIVIKEMNNVAELLGSDKKKIILMDFFFLSSMFYWNPVVILGQYDILALIFILRGFKYHIEKNEKKKVLAFAVAILFKQFALLPYVIIVLINEKNIFKIIKRLAMAFPILIVTEGIYYITDYDGKVAMNSKATSLMKLVESNAYPASLGQIMPGVLLVLLIFFFCYVGKYEDKYIEIKMTFLAYLSFFAMCIANPYWIILLLPFICIIIFSNEVGEKRNVLILSEMIMSFGYTLASFMAAEYSYSLSLVKFTWLGCLIEKIKPTNGTYGELISVADYIDKYISVEQLQTIGVTLFLAGSIGFVIVLRDKSNNFETFNSISDDALIIVRTIIGVLFSILIIATYLFT